MLRTCMMAWWERIGSTKVSGITKLMMSEAGNFPELATFYRAEVIVPGNELIRRILQRGVDRGEFRPMDMKYGVYTVLGPMLFVALWKHSYGTLSNADDHLIPQEYLLAQLDAILYGLSAQPRPNDRPAVSPNPTPQNGTP